MPSVVTIEQKIREHVEANIDFCTHEHETENFFTLEKKLRVRIFQLGCLFLQLLLIRFQEKFDYATMLHSGVYYLGENVPRTVKTIYGEVRYWRNYVTRKDHKGRGFYPLDRRLGLTQDGFSPFVMSLATKLATRVSFSVSVLLFKCFYGWSPSSEAIQALVLGMGRDADTYMELTDAPEDDGEILVIEVDGKATPTAKEDELKKRRGPRKAQRCCCQRHRNRKKRQCNCTTQREEGDTSKNGRSITLVVMYTLKKGHDGKLHGPVNKKVWGSYAPRKAMLAWARRQATKRGFPPDTEKRVHCVIDGEKCLYDGLSALFPKATFALDIRHVEEKIWKLGRLFQKKGSKELAQWVEEKVELLYSGHASVLFDTVKKLHDTLSARARRDKSKREAVEKLINYMEPRLHMMEYKKFIEEDLVIASGIVEGAARYVVGERMDCGGMRWIPERAEALLRLRCIELNDDWDHFFEWGYTRWMEKMKQGERIIIRQEKPDDLPDITSFNTLLIANDSKEGEWADAA
jgi:hypothetical protein